MRVAILLTAETRDSSDKHGDNAKVVLALFPSLSSPKTREGEEESRGLAAGQFAEGLQRAAVCP